MQPQKLHWGYFYHTQVGWAGKQPAPAWSFWVLGSHFHNLYILIWSLVHTPSVGNCHFVLIESSVHAGFYFICCFWIRQNHKSSMTEEPAVWFSAKQVHCWVQVRWACRWQLQPHEHQNKKNHRVFELEGTFKGHPAQLPCNEQGHPRLCQTALHDCCHEKSKPRIILNLGTA